MARKFELYFQNLFPCQSCVMQLGRKRNSMSSSSNSTTIKTKLQLGDRLSSSLLLPFYKCRMSGPMNTNDLPKITPLKKKKTKQ